MHRYEFYKSRNGGTFAVTVCLCCRIDGMQDAWFWPRGGEGRIRCGLSRAFIETLTRITEQEAMKRRPTLVQDGSA